MMTTSGDIIRLISRLLGADLFKLQEAHSEELRKKIEAIVGKDLDHLSPSSRSPRLASGSPAPQFRSAGTQCRPRTRPRRAHWQPRPCATVEIAWPPRRARQPRRSESTRSESARAAGVNVQSAPFRYTDRKGGGYIPETMAFRLGNNCGGIRVLRVDDASPCI